MVDTRAGLDTDISLEEGEIRESPMSPMRGDYPNHEPIHHARYLADGGAVRSGGNSGSQKVAVPIGWAHPPTA